MLSAQSKYALRALMFLSELEQNDYVKVSEVAKKTKLPGPYLSKLIKTLSKNGLVESRRGKNGGIKLHQKCSKITLYEICEALEDPLVKEECVLFKRPCNKQSPCTFHHEFSETKEKLLNYLRKTTLIQS